MDVFLRIMQLLLFAAGGAVLFLLFESAAELLSASWANGRLIWPDSFSLMILVDFGVSGAMVFFFGVCLAFALSFDRFVSLSMAKRLGCMFTIVICGGVMFFAMRHLGWISGADLTPGTGGLWLLLVVALSMVVMRYLTRVTGYTHNSSP